MKKETSTLETKKRQKEVSETPFLFPLETTRLEGKKGRRESARLLYEDSELGEKEKGHVVKYIDIGHC